MDISNCWFSRINRKEKDLNYQYLQKYSNHLGDLYWECIIMLKYAEKKGYQKLEWIDSAIINIERTINNIEELLSKKEKLSGQAEELMKVEESLDTYNQELSHEIILLPRIHKILQEQISPVTYQSIWITEPDESGSLHIRTIRLLRWCAFIFFGLFILFSMIKTGNQGAMETYRTLAIVFSAGLGSAFYALFTANRYIITRTFDMSYGSVYVTRFILGIFAGVILANFVEAYLKAHEVKFLGQLGPVMIAMLGGYSAEAVNRILKRIIAMIITLFEGEAQDIIRTKEQEMKAKFTAEDTKKRLNTAIELTRIYSEFQTSSEKKPETGDKIKELLNNLVGGLATEHTNSDSKAEISNMQKQIAELQAKINELEKRKPIAPPDGDNPPPVNSETLDNSKQINKENNNTAEKQKDK